MLKKIPVEHLCVGMYLQELCGSWMEHPFWRSTFRLDDPADIRRIVESGIREVIIDTARGRDVPQGEDAASVRVAAEAELRQAAAVPSGDARKSFAEEAQRAARICETAKRAVTSMFHEARMGKAIDAEAAAPLVEEISGSVLRNPGALISLARLKNKDDYTYLHSVAVSALMTALARELGLDAAAARAAGMAGLLHDIGKTAIPLSILNKPGKLTDAEFAVIRGHPAAGHKLLAEARGVSEAVLDVCLHHHEKGDGSGYPDRRGGGEITMFSRMAAVCDVYDAITSDRPYKQGWDPAEALRKMAEWSKGHFDETIFHAFVKCIGIYPVGSLLRLHSGRLAVVVDQSGTLLAPRVKVFFSTRSNARIVPETIDLAHAGCTDKVLAHEDPARWNFPDLDLLWRPAAVAAP